ncbi:hypothetical protein T459_23185 [Capsicum annuum]|uniref:Uncharacterized protein n=1 Tax=Capsicum annuum TaxID=4072 RepID=A0A2G2YRM8_CAPAN|nr:hypothetical protein T459_23185 [Capsicum annuum]
MMVADDSGGGGCDVTLLGVSSWRSLPSFPYSVTKLLLHLRPASRWAGFFELFRTKSKRYLTKYPQNSSLKVLSKRFSRSMRELVGAVKSSIVDDDFKYFKLQWRNFTLSELQVATNSF